MPIFIKLTINNGQERYFNASKINQFAGNKGGSWVEMDNDFTDVKESPEEILHLIKQASMLITETTVSTEYEIPLHIVRD